MIDLTRAKDTHRTTFLKFEPSKSPPVQMHFEYHPAQLSRREAEPERYLGKDTQLSRLEPQFLD
jgi:hypothetical protein